MNINRITRNAVSLVELLVVMSACTVILTTSAMLIHRVMHTHAKTRDFLDNERSALRLSNQFRRDVHLATSATRPIDQLGNDQILLLTLPGDVKIEYQQQAGRVNRTLYRDNSRISQQEFAFPRHVSLTILEEAAPRRLILTIVENQSPLDVNNLPQSPRSDTAPLSLHVEATLGRDQTISAPSTSEEAQE